jgi:hypothetical protein
MRRSLWLPIALAAVLMLLVVAAQLGVTAAESAKGLAAGLKWLRTVGAPLIAVAACVAWIRTRKRAVGFYAIGMSASALAGVASRMGIPQVWPFANALFPIGLSLAAITWASRERRTRRALPGTLLALAAVVAILDGAVLWPASPIGNYQYLLPFLNALHFACWIAMSAVAWQGYNRQPERPLLWLAAQGAALALEALPFVPIMPGLLWFPGWIWSILFTLPLAMAVGVVMTAIRSRRPS